MKSKAKERDMTTVHYYEMRYDMGGDDQAARFYYTGGRFDAARMKMMDFVIAMHERGGKNIEVWRVNEELLEWATPETLAEIVGVEDEA